MPPPFATTNLPGQGHKWKQAEDNVELASIEKKPV